MLNRFIAALQDSILRNPWRVIALTLVSVALALGLGSQVEMRTSRSELSPPDDPDQRRFDEFLRESGGASDLIACVEAAPGVTKAPEDLRRFTDVLALEFEADPEVARVFHKIDLGWLLEHGLWLAPPTMIREAVAAVRNESETLKRLPAVRDVADLNDLLAERLEKELASGSAAPPEKEAAEGIAQLVAFLDFEKRFLDDPGAVLAPLESGPALMALAGDRPEVASRGYLATRDGRTLFLLISPKDKDDSLPTLERLVKALRRDAGRVGRANPDFHVAFTGEPAMNVEEMSVVARDTWFTGLIAAAGVTLLTVLVFRWKSHALLVLAALAAGIAWSFGAVYLELGYLNLITSSFISTLVGVGIAYGIHPVSEYELQGAHTVNPADAIRRAYHATGPGVAVGGITTAAAFLSILLMKFKGFAELGLVAGVGVIMCLIAALVALPAILLVYGRRRARTDRAARHTSPGAAVDRLWVERGARLVCLRPRTTTAVSLLLTAALAYAAWGVGFDPNILALLPRNSESVRYQNRMIMESSLSPVFNVVMADDTASLRAALEHAAAEPAVERSESILDLLPADPEGSRAALQELGEILEDVHLPSEAGPLRRDKLAASLQRLVSAFERSSEAAFGAGMGSLAGPLEEARNAADALRAAVAAAPAEREAVWADGQRRLLAFGRRALDEIRGATRVDAPAPSNLPAEIRERLVTSNGKLIAYLYPKESIFEPGSLDRFVEASRRISREAAGFPIVFRSMSARITSGFHRAAITAGVLVLLILFAKFRHPRDMLLALVPKVMGVIWMMGGMRLLGLSYNFANLVAVPLILGVGIDNGVHIINRMRMEGREGMTVVLQHTGRAILVAGLTTMIGFGSLALASHRGLSSLGTVLLLGLGSTILCATVVLPNILVAFGVAKR